MLYETTKAKIRKAVESLHYSKAISHTLYTAYLKDTDRLYRKLNALGIDYWNFYTQYLSI